MRVVGGEFKGAKLQGPLSPKTRPTLDQTRESIFNIILSHFLKNDMSIETMTVLDVFAGTGALGIEALSRGAKDAYFFEKEAKALQGIYSNIEHLRLQERAHIIKGDVLRVPEAKAVAHLAFFDPPYHENLLEAAVNHLFIRGWITKHTFLVMEMARDEGLFLENYHVMVEKNYKETKICCAQIK
ncbi:MAG: 16S rRNA (guanine(966)-N(2))-methyltransferase RsmD [Alphaproteobacteria bacterium]|nr:16S rRNA (guanine(966)-N(2))-methyltransferase RsmD [Alphaproteobacteria bacterium]